MADKTVYVHPVGDDTGDHYHTLSSAIAGELIDNADLTAAGMDGILNIIIDGSWSSGDTATINVDGFTTDASHYINIYTTGAARHQGIISSTAYRYDGTTGGSFTLNDAYIHLDGIQIDCSGHSGAIYGIYTTNTTGVLWMSNILIKMNNDVSSQAINLAGTNTNYLWNVIAYMGGTTPNYCCWAAGTNYFYNCVLIGGGNGLLNYGTNVMKNCYIGGTASEAYFHFTGSLAKTNCASADASADDTESGETQSNCIINKALDTDTFVNVTFATADFHLSADGLSPLQAAGVNTSGDSSPLDFTTDIDGDTRDATWDIGADAATAAATNIMLNII